MLEQVPRITEALVTLSKDCDPKTYSESNSFLHSICDFEFVYGLMVLKLILSNTDNLSRYLQGEQMDVITAKKTADAVVKDGAYYCYCAYVLRISRYSDFLSPMLTNTGIFLRGLKLSGESRS